MKESERIITTSAEQHKLLTADRVHTTKSGGQTSATEADLVEIRETHFIEAETKKETGP